MEGYDYSAKIEEIANRTSVQRQSIFEYDFHPEKDAFEEIFSFYQFNLEQGLIDFAINPNGIYCNTKTTINAYAQKDSDYYLISLNLGLIIKLFEIFKNNQDLTTNIEGIEEYLSFSENLDNPLHVSIYQLALHFIFYHEAGHLVQYSDLDAYKTFENLNNSGVFDISKHIKEIDADEYACLWITKHIVRYSNRLHQRGMPAGEIEKLIIIAATSMLLVMLIFAQNKPKIYYKKFSHPHPIVRIISIVFTLTGSVRRNISFLPEGINFNQNELVSKTLSLTEKLGTKLFGTYRENYFQDILAEKGIDIYNYLAELQLLKLRNEELAVSKWNLLASRANHN